MRRFKGGWTPTKLQCCHQFLLTHQPPTSSFELVPTFKEGRDNLPKNPFWRKNPSPCQRKRRGESHKLNMHVIVLLCFICFLSCISKMISYHPEQQHWWRTPEDNHQREFLTTHLTHNILHDLPILGLHPKRETD